MTREHPECGERGDLQPGLDAFVEASFKQPDLVAARLDAAETMAAMGNFDAAADWASSVLRLDPKHETAQARVAYYRELAVGG